MNDSDSFFAERSADYVSRPRAVNPRTGQEQAWQRASNYAAPLDNPHGLIKWQLRELIKGISLRPDLARMLLAGAAIEDNAKADEIIKAAHATAEIDAKANNGTAVHAALSRSFLGHELQPEFRPHVEAFAAELKRNGLEPRVTEVTLFNTRLGSIGHVDWIVKTADGRFLVLDVKTGKLGDSKRKFAVQCVNYASADYMTGPDIADSKTPVPIPWEIDQHEAILAHVDPETGATALYRVDLTLGLYGATLAERVRDWHKIEVLTPYVPVHAAIPTLGAKHPEHVDSARAMQPITFVQAPAEIETAPQPPAQELADTRPRCHVMITNPTGTYPCGLVLVDGLCSDAHHNQTPQTSGVYSSALQQTFPSETALTQAHAEEQRLQQIESAQSSPIVPVTGDPASIATGQAFNESVDAEKSELLKLDKAALQAKAKNEHGATDLAHNREWLACYIIAKRRGCDESAAVMFAKSKGTMGLGGAASFSRPKPSQEQLRSIPETGDLSFMLKAIAGAKSIGAITALQENLIQRRGDQAWTEEMTEAAKERCRELDAMQTAGETSPVVQAFKEIGEATEPAHIAAIWSRVTMNGAMPDNWTAELKAAGDSRMVAIQQNQSAPPANPYGPQA